MPSLDTYKKMLTATGNTIGQAHKSNSDLLMEFTWDRDIQSKVAYIYDFYHDDNPLQRKGFTYENTRKTKIDVKHIYSQANSMVKDTPEMFLQFKPSQKMSNFDESDDLYYYHTGFYERYLADFPVGLYVDLPNEKGIYERYLICKTDDRNQFVKHLILKCDYLFQFIEENGNQRIKRQMWGCTRSQSSYNSGLWSDNIETIREDQEKIILPLNPITEYIDTNHPSKQNMRVFVGAPTTNIKVWQVSKIQDNQTPARGVKMVTLSLTERNNDTDYINVDTKEFYADYYAGVTPSDQPTPSSTSQSMTCTITATNNQIKVGGSYKTLIAKFYDFTGAEMTETLLSSLSLSSWKCYIDDVDVTDFGLITLVAHSDLNKIKIKFSSDRSYLGKILAVKCVAEYDKDMIVGEIKLDIISM